MTYTNIAEASLPLHLTLPVKPKPQPGWLQASEKRLPPLIEARNEAMRNILRIRTRLNGKKLQQTCKKLKTAVRNAKHNWI